MSASWRPGSNFAQTCLMAGLHNADFTENELNAFVSYWAGRHELRNQHAWERAFALRLLKRAVPIFQPVKTLLPPPQQQQKRQTQLQEQPKKLQLQQKNIKKPRVIRFGGNNQTNIRVRVLYHIFIKNEIFLKIF